MMTLSEQIQRITRAIEQTFADCQLSQDEKRKENTRKRRQMKRRKVPVVRSPEEIRAEYQAVIIATLTLTKEPLNSVTIGAAMTTTRATAFKRLCVLEDEGLVERVGDGVKTKWLINTSRLK